MDFNKAIKYTIIGGLAVVLPGIIGNFLPVQGVMLGAVLLGASLVLAGKLPSPVPQALGVSGGMLLAGGLFGNLLGSFTTATSPASGGEW